MYKEVNNDAIGTRTLLKVFTLIFISADKQC